MGTENVRGDVRSKLVVDTPFLKSIHHCFLERQDCYFTEPWTSLTRHSLFTLETYDISAADFDGLPQYPKDCFEGISLCPFVHLERQETNDLDGNHAFWLFRLKTSLTTVLAGVPATEFGRFCWLWSQHEIYSPFQGWESLPPEVAQRTCQEKAFQKLFRFFQVLGPLCREACATQRAVYVLWERHEKPLSRVH
jgi:hypothetical protein